MTGQHVRLASAAAIVALVIGGVMLACGGKTVAPSTSADNATRSPTVNGRQRQMPRGDELYWRVGARAPGFGGFYLDDAGNPTIVLLDPSDSANARVAVSQLLGGCSSAHPCRLSRDNSPTWTSPPGATR